MGDQGSKFSPFKEKAVTLAPIPRAPTVLYKDIERLTKIN